METIAPDPWGTNVTQAPVPNQSTVIAGKEERVGAVATHFIMH